MRHNRALRALLVVRRLEAQAAELRLSEARLVQDRAETSLQSYADALRQEAGQAGSNAFAAWLPAIRDATGQAASACRAAEAGHAMARAAVASASLAEKAAADAIQRWDKARLNARREREQLQLDDFAPAHSDQGLVVEASSRPARR